MTPSLVTAALVFAGYFGWALYFRAARNARRERELAELNAEFLRRDLRIAQHWAHVLRLRLNEARAVKNHGEPNPPGA